MEYFATEKETFFAFVLKTLIFLKTWRRVFFFYVLCFFMVFLNSLKLMFSSPFFKGRESEVKDED